MGGVVSSRGDKRTATTIAEGPEDAEAAEDIGPKREGGRAPAGLEDNKFRIAAIAPNVVFLLPILRQRTTSAPEIVHPGETHFLSRTATRLGTPGKGPAALPQTPGPE